MSPYLFVLCLDRLAYLIQDFTNEGKWKPFFFGKANGIPISHLFFANNIILAVEETFKENSRYLMFGLWEKN